MTSLLLEFRIYAVSEKKQDTILCIFAKYSQIFEFFSSIDITSKFVIKSLINFPPHLKYVTTLPCEISVLKTLHAQGLCARGGTGSYYGD